MGKVLGINTKFFVNGKVRYKTYHDIINEKMRRILNDTSLSEGERKEKYYEFVQKLISSEGFDQGSGLTTLLRAGNIPLENYD